MTLTMIQDDENVKERSPPDVSLRLHSQGFQMTQGKSAYPCVIYLFPTWVLNSQVSEDNLIRSKLHYPERVVIQVL